MSEPGILPNPIPFGKYYLLERINVGGMAEVYKAKAFGVEGFERLLAVKKILSAIAEDEAFINMFIDEAKISGQLSHPNIAQIFDLGKVDGSYFIALEYIGGKDLKTIFERARRLGEKVSIPRICYTIMKICEGLNHAHHKKGPDGNELHIVHRDISPQNVLISYEGEVKIIDFGIAKAQGKTSQTQVGILKGKFSYMSPEQVRGLHVDHRSDLFSLGIVLYELLTLERLFLGESDFDTLEKIRKVEMSPPSLYNPHIPKELEDIVLKSLARSPDDRFSNSSEFAEALERFMRAQGYYYTNKDLGSYMKESFSADIEFENKKLEYYKSLNLQPIEQGPPPSNSGNAPSPPSNAGLSWGEEEMETQIFDRMDEEFLDSELDEADIVYASDASDASDASETGETSTTQGWNDGSGGIEFTDEPPQPRNNRQRQPTAQIAAVEPRRVQSGTVHAIHKQSNGKRRLAAIAVFAIVVGLGVLIMSKMTGSAPLYVETEPKSVQVVVNGEIIHDGDTPFEHKLALGLTTIELKREGFETFSTTQDIESDNEYRLTVGLEPLNRMVEILVKSDPPGADVYLNGAKQSESTPMTLKELKDDKVMIKVTKDGFFEDEREVILSKNPPDSLDVRLKPAKIALKVTSVPDRAEYAVFMTGTSTKVGGGRTPDTLKGLDAAKKYDIKINRKKYEPWNDTFEPGFDPEPVIEANLRRAEDNVVSNTVFVPPKKDRTKKPKTIPPKKDPPKKNIVKKDPPKKDPPVAKGTGTVSVASKPVARVYIDGQDTGRYTPLMNFKVKSGKRKIQLKNPDFGLDKTYYVNVKPGDKKRIINKP